MIGNVTPGVGAATNLGGGKRKAKSGNAETAKSKAQRGLDSGVSKSNGQDLDELFMLYWDPVGLQCTEKTGIRAELDSFTFSVEMVDEYSKCPFDGSDTLFSDELDTASDGSGTTVSDESYSDGENVDPLLGSQLVIPDPSTTRSGRIRKPSYRNQTTDSAVKAKKLPLSGTVFTQQKLAGIFNDS